MKKLILILSLLAGFSYSQLLRTPLITTTNLYGYAHKDSVNIFTLGNTFSDTVKFNKTISTSQALTLRYPTANGILSMRSFSGATEFYIAGTDYCGSCVALKINNTDLLFFTQTGLDFKVSTDKLTIRADSVNSLVPLWTPKDWDTSNFSGGATGTVTQTGQSNTVIIINPVITQGTDVGELVVTNGYIDAYSVVSVSVGVASPEEFGNRGLNFSYAVTADNTLKVWIVPSISLAVINTELRVDYKIEAK